MLGSRRHPVSIQRNQRPQIDQPVKSQSVGGPRRGESDHRRIPAGSAFWFVTAAFTLTLALSGVPTPLYVLYERRDGFNSLMLTVVFAAYAVGVVISLLLGGHVSDWVGRRRVLVPAMGVAVAASIVFAADPNLGGIFTARVLTGLAVGLTSATATAYLTELSAQRETPGASQRRQAITTAANLGGIGVGPLISGLLAQYGPNPLRLVYIVFAIALTVLGVIVYLGPETGLFVSKHGWGVAGRGVIRRRRAGCGVGSCRSCGTRGPGVESFR